MGIPGRIRRLLRLGLFLWVLVFLASAGHAQKVPEWLFHPPGDAHHLYGVGIAPKFLEDSLSIIVAKQNAIENLTKQYSVTVEAKFAESGDGSGILSTGYVKEIADSTHIWQCRTSAEVVEGIRTQKHLFLLMRVGKNLNPPEDSLKLKSKLVKISSMEAPPWVSELPQQDHTIYGLGISQAYTHLSDAWEASAREARREIAMTLSAESATLSREIVTERGTYHRNWSEDITKKTMRHSVIEARWFDPEKDLYYTLVSYRNLPDRH